MPPPGYEPFLRAICEHPADDAPRLVYADWLDEHGDPERAEFIRMQIARAAAQARGETAAEFEERDRALRQTFEIRWRCELPVLSGVIWHRFWRGFVSGADFSTGRWFVKQAAAAVAAVPLQFVRLFRLSDRHMTLIAESGALDRVAQLTFVDPNGISSTGWRDFARSEHLRALRSLRLIRRPRGSFGPYIREPVVDLDGAAHLATSAALWGLEELLIAGSLSERAVAVLQQRFGPRFRHGGFV